MRLLTISQFAKEAGVKRQTIYNRLRWGHLEAVATTKAFIRIDASKYPPSQYSARKRGVKAKAKI